MSKLAPPLFDYKRMLLPAVCALGLIGLCAMAVAGPSGVLAWRDHEAKLAEYRGQIAQLEAEEAELRNRVALLSPDQRDMDYSSELVREALNVVGDDEYVVDLEPAP